ncbi:MAG: hypothetical protein JW864_06860 [Spirochaetes bacterium]|nr:hypothetical protein [Spirochaetota bacterium]
MGVPEKGYEYLTPPVITDCWQEGDNIILEFRGYNDEYYFDGYNVYVSETSMKRTDVASYKAVELEGYGSTTPSFPLSPDDYDPDNLREVTLYHYYLYLEDTGEYLKYPFSTGTYYIRMCSHHSVLGVSEDAVSNQKTVEFNE